MQLIVHPRNENTLYLILAFGHVAGEHVRLPRDLLRPQALEVRRHEVAEEVLAPRDVPPELAAHAALEGLPDVDIPARLHVHGGGKEFGNLVVDAVHCLGVS